MFSQKIAQVTSTDTDATLQNLNVKLDLLKEEYNAVASEPNTYSFFNLDNIYFWFVLAGLLLLAFGLLFLLAEIQNKSDKTKKNKKVVLDEVVEDLENDEEPILEEEPEIESKIKEEIKKSKSAKKASWFKKEKKSAPGGPAKGREESKEIVEEDEEIEDQEPIKSKAKGPIKIKVEKIK